MCAGFISRERVSEGEAQVTGGQFDLLSHVCHMRITCLSRAYHMFVTCVSCVCHMRITCLSHAYHMFVTCISCACHMYCRLVKMLKKKH